MGTKKHIRLLDLLLEFEGDSNPLNVKYVDIWHKGQYLAQAGDTNRAIRLMTKAAKLAAAKNSKGEEGYYLGTIAWLNNDYSTVEKYIKDPNVIETGNHEVLNRLLANKGKSYKEAYLTTEEKQKLGLGSYK